MPCRAPACSNAATGPGISIPASTRRTSARRRCARSCSRLRERGYFKGLWREEDYAVAPQEGTPFLMAMERSAVPWFGVRAGGRT